MITAFSLSLFMLYTLVFVPGTVSPACIPATVFTGIQEKSTSEM